MTQSLNHPAALDQGARTYRCFDLPFARPATKPDWFGRWRTAFQGKHLDLTSAQEEALGRLLPALLCGEQSAIVVFHAAAMRLSHRARRASLTVFGAIEADEDAHETSLQIVTNGLTAVAGATAIRRRSQVFFARLGRVDSIARHFAQISQLDSATCVVMWHLQHCTVGGDSMLGVLASQIKRDEARHVSISRKHAFDLGLSRDDYRVVGAKVRTELIELLGHVVESFEAIGIDPDRMFKKIHHGVVS